MPKLWSDTVEAHRRAVREAVLDAAGMLVHTRGLPAVTMSGIAEASGLGRATLYKYFPDIESVLLAWHERHVSEHLDQLMEVSRTTAAGRRLPAVLEAYAVMMHERGGNQAAGFLHQDAHVAHAREALSSFLRDLIADEVASGTVRDDVSPSELAQYCLHALAAAAALPSTAAARRLGAITLDALRARSSG